MHLFGAALWTLFLLLTTLLSGKEAARALDEERGLCRLLAHVKEHLDAAPEPLSSLFASFEDEALARAGFLAVLEREGLASALESGTLCLSESTLCPLKAYAEGLGARSYAAEKAAAQSALSSAKQALTESEAAYPRKRRLTSTLLLTGGALVLLLLI